MFMSILGVFLLILLRGIKEIWQAAILALTDKIRNLLAYSSKATYHLKRWFWWFSDFNFTLKLLFFTHPLAPVTVTVTSFSSRRFPMKMHGSTSASVSPDLTGIGFTRFKSATSSLPPSGNRMLRTAAKPRFGSPTGPHVNDGNDDWLRIEPLKFAEKLWFLFKQFQLDNVSLKCTHYNEYKYPQLTKTRKDQKLKQEIKIAMFSYC